MRKRLSRIIVCFMIITLFMGTLGLCASADFGIGVSVMANNTKLIKTGLFGKRINFSESDFKSALNISDFDSITIKTIPSSTEGTLMYGGRRVIAGRVIKRKNIGLLSFVPASNSISEAKFSFTIEPASSNTSIECVMKFVDKVNYAPSAEDTAVLNTQSEIAYVGRLKGEDPEGDKLEFMVVKYPKNGELSLKKDDGSYSYSPYDDFVGNDKFSYVIRDEYGNYSEVMTVNIKVSERMCDTVYVDMIGKSEYNGAVAMTAMGIMSGKIVGDDIYFEADVKVTRAEFTAMAMKAMGIRPDSTLGESFFDDNKDIPKSLRPYISTAARIGLAKGDFVNGKLIFRPNDEITNYEIAKIIATLCNLSCSEEASEYMESESIPIWARESVSAMYTIGIFDIGKTTPDSVATRAEVADYLYKMLLFTNK